MKSLPRLALLASFVVIAGCASSSGPAKSSDEAPDGAISRPTDRRGDAATVAGSHEDAAEALDVADDGPEAEDVGAAPDRPRMRAPDAARAFDATGRESGRVRSCMAGATCAPNARCERSCMSGEVYRCTCTEGHFVCTGCIASDGGAPDGAVAGFCAGNVSVQGRRCDHAGDVCHYATDGGQRLCACGDVGPQRLWICQ